MLAPTKGEPDMAMQSPGRRYAVVQEKSWVKVIVAKAIDTHQTAELDLYNDEIGMIKVKFILDTGLYDPEVRTYSGETTDYRSINLHIPQDGEVYALLSD